MQALLTAMVGSLLSVLCAVVLLLLFVYIWASMGVKFFLNAPDDLAAVVGNTLAGTSPASASCRLPTTLNNLPPVLPIFQQ